MESLHAQNWSHRPSATGLMLFRYEAVISDYMENVLILLSFSVVRETRCKYVICVFGKDKYVDKGTHKRYAYPTKEQAWKSFNRRCVMWTRFAHTNLRRAEAALEISKREMPK